jgi:transcription termination/antitermination protein NusG
VIDIENAMSVQSISRIPAVPARGENRWYAAYTCARHEKRVAQLLNERRVENFLPLYRTVSRWKDRRKELQLALFPGYVFVRMDLKDRLRVLQLPGVVSFVSFGGTPAPLGESEIEGLRNGLTNNGRVEAHPYVAEGRRVRIVAGPFSGVEGFVVRRKDKLRVVLSISLIRRSIAIEVSESDIDAIYG